MNSLFKASAILSLLFLNGTLLLMQPSASQAATTESLSCSVSYQINKTFANQAKWEMCWEPKAGIGYKLTQVIFTPPNGIRRKIFGALHAAQLFVPYDDNGARYHDITYGVNLAALSATECPGGVLLTNSTLCLRGKPAGYAYKNLATGTSKQSDSFELFGYYGIGNYYYTFKYTFFDDGAIEPSVLASGSLQRWGGTQLTGWPVGANYAVNHSHLVFWRMDFDLDGPSNNLVEQIEFNGSGTDSRNMTVIPLLTETKATNDMAKSRFWRIRNTSQTNRDGRNISYEIEPSVSDQLRSSETFTQNDFYLTQNRVGEDLVDTGLVGFVNGETVTDPVLWYGVNFHHVPRGEDDIKMPAHSQGFRIRPRDLTTTFQATTNTPPTITNPGDQIATFNSSVSLQISARDVDTADTLTFSASGLPSGLSINSSTGLISGTVATNSTTTTATVTVTVSDGHAGNNVSTTFTWNINTSSATEKTFGASTSITIRDNTTAQPYPVNFNVSGLSGTINKVTVTLNGVSHTYSSDIDIILVGPGGQKSILMSDAGGASALNNTTIKFDPTASVFIPTTQIASGSYKPANLNGGGNDDNFPTPGPGNGNTATLPADLNVFNGSLPNGIWTLYITDDAATDSGQIAGGAALTITTSAPVDSTAPTLTGKSPAANATGVTLGSAISAQFSESMSSGSISNTTFTLQSASGQIPATVSYNDANKTATLTPQNILAANTSYTATVKGGTGGVKDAAGNQLVSDANWSFTTLLVNTPPTVNLTAPANNAAISGAAISVTATAADAEGIAGVQFMLDGINLGAEDTTAPYGITWDSTTSISGTHNLTAKVRDSGGITVTSAPVTVNVNNAALPDVVVTSMTYANGYFTSTIKNQGAAVTPTGIWVGVGYYVDGVYRSFGIAVQNLAAGASATIAANTAPYFIPSGIHTIKAHVDDINRFAESDETNNLLTQTITVGTNDTTPPSIILTAPAGGSTVGGTNVAVSASASDNIGLTGVQFKLDGVNLAVEDTSAPFSIGWDSTTTTNGNHTLTAVARDTSGNTTTSTAIAVGVDNTVGSLLPDVIVTNVAYYNGIFTSTVKNQGTAATPTDIWVGVGYYVDGVYKSYGLAVRDLAPGASATIAPSTSSYLIPSGTHTVVAHVDDINRFAESDENNNTASLSINVP